MELNELVSASRQFVDELEKYRDTWESQTHWYARKTFLRHNWEKFEDKERLLCLSSAWANVEFSGNRYPNAVMQQLQELTSEMEPSSVLLRDAEKQVTGNFDESAWEPTALKTRKLPGGMVPVLFVKQTEKTATNKKINSKNTTPEKGGEKNLERNKNWGQKAPEIPPEKTLKNWGGPEKEGQKISPKTSENNCKTTSSQMGLKKALTPTKSGDFPKKNNTGLNPQNNGGLEKPSLYPVPMDTDTPAPPKPLNRGKITLAANFFGVNPQPPISVAKPQFAPTTFGEVPKKSTLPQNGEKIPQNTSTPQDSGGIPKSQLAITENVKLLDLNQRSTLAPSVTPTTPGNPLTPPTPSRAQSVLINKLLMILKNQEINEANRTQIFANSVQSLKTNPVFKYNRLGPKMAMFKKWAEISKIPFKFQPSSMICDVYVLDVFIAQGYGTGRPSAQADALSRLMLFLHATQVFVISAQRRLDEKSFLWQFILSTTSFTPDKGITPPICCVTPPSATPPAKALPPKTPTVNQSKPFDKFVIRESPNANPISTIYESAQFNHLPFEYDIQPAQRLMWRCTLTIGGRKIATATDPNSKSAKLAVAEQALVTLKRFYPTFVERKIHQNNSEQSNVSRNDLLTSAPRIHEEQRLTEENIGNKLLRKMGWGGSGGLGKSGEGRTDPVILTSSFNRRGFGTNQNEPTIISSKDATRVLKEFLAKNCDGELTFSSELDGNERKVIHETARKFGLSSKSYGKGEQRYLVVTRKICAEQIISDFNNGLNYDGHQIIAAQKK
nr:uncharacterized protein LOC100181284 [Ciona intestinalis]|eukprot:XP_026694722.1 uncharacterized protein LOC100181284 [Ciona intestinalis]